MPTEALPMLSSIMSEKVGARLFQPADALAVGFANSIKA